MEVEQIPENVLNIIKNNPDLIAKNMHYLKTIGIKNPESLVHIKPELFILSNKLVKQRCNNINVELVNENPYTLLDMID